jgi:WD40 repeat protein
MSLDLNQCPDRPYVGATVIQDPRLFYGRDAETDAVVDNLLAYRILLLFSPSGAGKSSLIESGVKPRLQKDFHILPTIRVNRKPQPGEIPEGTTYNRFTLSALLSLQGEAEVQAHAVLPSLAGYTLAEYLEQHNGSSGQGERTLLIFDQFEELLTTDLAARKEIEDFLEDLMAVLYDFRYWAIFAMREDYLAELEPYLSYFPDRLSTHFYLKLLGKDAAAEAIIKPAKLCQVDFTPKAAEKLVNDLSTKRIPGPSGVVEQPGDTVEPVQLQVVCANFWDSFREKHPESTVIGVDDLPSLADIDDALSKHYDRKLAEVVTRLSVSELGIRDWFDNELIANQSFRQQSLQGVEARYGLTRDAVKMLMDGYLVREDTRLGTTWYELAHDRLIQPVCLSNARWYNENLPQLLRTSRNWLRDKEPDDYLLSGKLLEEALAWAQANPLQVDEDVKRFLEKSEEAEKRIQQEIARAHEAELTQVKQEETFKRLALQLEANKRQKSALVGLSIAVIVALAMAGLVVYFYRQSIQDGREARYNLGGQFGLISQNVPAGQALEKLASAIRAMKVTGDYAEYESTEARHAAYDALVSTGGFQLLNGLGDAAVIAGSPAGDLAVTNSADQLIVLTAQQIHDAAGLASSLPLEQSLELSAPGVINALAFNPDGILLAAGLKGGETSARIWDLSLPDPQGDAVDLSGHAGDVRAVKFSPDGKWLATAGDDGKIRLWSTSGLAHEPLVLEQDGAAVSSLDFSARGRWLASGGDDGMTVLWNLLSADPSLDPVTLPDHEAAVKALAYSPDGRWLATGSGDGSVRLWDTTAEDPSQASIELLGHTPQVAINAIAFHQAGGWLATGSDDQSVCLWDLSSIDEVLQTDEELHCEPRFTGHANSVLELVFDPSEQWLATGDANGEIHLWGGPVNESQVLARHAGAILGMVFDPFRDWLATVGADGQLYLWRMQGSPVTTLPALLPGSGSPITSLQVSPDGDWLIGLDPSGMVNGWKIDQLDAGLEALSTYQGLETQANLASYLGILEDEEANTVLQAVFHPGGHWLATGNQSGGVALWDLDEQPPQQQELSSRFNLVSSLAFNPAGDLLAAAGSIGDSGRDSLQVWPVHMTDRQGGLSAELPVSLGADLPLIERIAFSPDGRWLAAAGEAGYLKIWDLSGGLSAAEAKDLSGHETTVRQLAFTPDSSLLVSGSDDDGQVLAWDLIEQEPVPVDLLLASQQAAGSQAAAQQPDYIGGVKRLETSSDGRWLAVTHDISSQALLIDIDAALAAAGDNGQEQGAAGELVSYSLDCGRYSPSGFVFIEDIETTRSLAKSVAIRLGFDDDLPQGTNRWLAVGYQDGGICLWDLRDPDSAPVVLNDDPLGVTGLAASAQGSWLASAGSNGGVHVWPLDIDVLYRLACTVYNDYLVVPPPDRSNELRFLGCAEF